ncbi:hypothetical protein [Chryseolinea lacunae]|uniref:Uncharacterized protein n=1 Tax=Chryseolinea lacunae TaxID=2801331 RepID=A0ABS1KU39_9BACT|nr:hypothetical protein [Chryseolinea lacunae]MBL0742808.1 hypothetical protein [Chryseolinea lacunae]
MRTIFLSLFISSCGMVVMSCGEKKTEGPETTFTRIDSLTDSYLALQDSMLQSWNMMINDDNQKVSAMHNLLHELIVSTPDKREQLKEYEERLNQLSRLRYTQKSMGNADVVEEYDFASTSLITELISMAETKAEFTYNTTLQKLVDDIRMADQRVNNYRAEYDLITARYNTFLDKNRADLKEINHGDSLELKPLFQMVSVE